MYEDTLYKESAFLNSYIDFFVFMSVITKFITFKLSSKHFITITIIIRKKI